MSKTKEKGYEFNLQIMIIGSIKPVPSGTFSDRNGKQIKYKGSVNFNVMNVETVEDELLGEKEVESILAVKIPCENDVDIKPLNEYIRVLKDRNEIFQIPVSMPRQSDGSTFKTTCTMDSKAFILMMEKHLKKVGKS